MIDNKKRVLVFFGFSELKPFAQSMRDLSVVGHFLRFVLSAATMIGGQKTPTSFRVVEAASYRACTK